MQQFNNLNPQPQDNIREFESASRFIDHSSLGLKDRPANTVSMYVGVGKTKIYAKPSTGVSKNSQGRRSQSTQIQKKFQRNLLRYKKLDVKTNQATFSSMNPLKQFKRQAVRGKVRAGLSTSDVNLRDFLIKVQAGQMEFVGLCHEQRYSSAIQVIIRLLNYAVDYNLPEQFLRSLKTLADLYFLTGKIDQAVFYYDQSRQACILLNHPSLLVESLMGLAQCCCKSGLENDGIKILKKALEYSWLYSLDQLQLRLFDQIGKLHYYLGDLKKAKQYHTRHVNAQHQHNNSALRILSSQRILKAQQINVQIKFKQISIILLVHLKAPIKSVEQIPPPFEFTEHDQIVRNNFNISSKYFGGNEVGVEIRHILKGWFFREQIEDPSLPDGDWNTNKPKKYAFLDFQLNQHLKRLGKGVNKDRRQIGNNTFFPVKQSLEEQVSRKMKEQPLKPDWYESIVKQINRDHRNKLLNVRDAVRIRGFNKKIIPSMQILRDVYNMFFQHSKPITPLMHNTSIMSRDYQ